MDIFLNEAHLFIRILAAAISGAIIGFERKSRYKEAGMRTHAFVCAGSALIMIISKYGFGDSDHADKSRVAAQIVSGIGFLGAGIIVYRKQVLRGLTTAAGVWMTAGVGMAFGAGFFYIGGAAVLLMLTLHFIFSLPLNIFLTKRFYGVKVNFNCSSNEIEAVKRLFSCSRFSSVEYRRDGETQYAIAEIYTQDYMTEEQIFTILQENSFINTIKRIVE